MEQLFGLMLVFTVGTIGFFVFKFARVPNPALLGAMFSTGILNITGLYPSLTLWPISFAANVVIGIMLGRQIDRSFFKKVKAVSFYVVLMAAGLIVLSLICGYTFYKLTEVSLKTSLVATSAGGITEMMIFGMSIDADLPVVACLQLFRVVIFLTLIPFISTIGKGKVSPMQLNSIRDNMPTECFEKQDYFLMVIFAFFGAAIFAYYEIPTGAMLGAMFSAGLFSVIVKKTYCYDTRLRMIAQIGLGVVMGNRMTYSIVTQLGSILLPALATTVVMLVGCILLAYLLHKISGWDMLTCLLCAAPAGLSQITVFAEEIGADSFTASLFHTVRIISIVTIYPWIVLWAI